MRTHNSRILFLFNGVFEEREPDVNVAIFLLRLHFGRTLDSAAAR
jgi:hypothetical protein